MTQQLNNNNKGIVAYKRQLSGRRGPRGVSQVAALKEQSYWGKEWVPPERK